MTLIIEYLCFDKILMFVNNVHFLHNEENYDNNNLYNKALSPYLYKYIYIFQFIYIYISNSWPNV